VIQRLASTIVGGLVTFLLLLLFHNGRLISNETTGAVVSLFWPWIWSRFMDRRRQQARQQAVRVEVARQVDEHRAVESEPPVE
jgi:hypothetical protein